MSDETVDQTEELEAQTAAGDPGDESGNVQNIGHELGTDALKRLQEQQEANTRRLEELLARQERKAAPPIQMPKDPTRELSKKLADGDITHDEFVAAQEQYEAQVEAAKSQRLVTRVEQKIPGGGAMIQSQDFQNWARANGHWSDLQDAYLAGDTGPFIDAASLYRAERAPKAEKPKAEDKGEAKTKPISHAVNPSGKSGDIPLLTNAPVGTMDEVAEIQRNFLKGKYSRDPKAGAEAKKRMLEIIRSHEEKKAG